MNYVVKCQDRLDAFKERLGSLSNEQVAYLAGILDGEGSIGLYQATKYKRHSIMTRITLIVNTDKKLIDFVASLVGNEFLYKGNCNNMWCVKISHRLFAEAFLERVIPFLVSKKDRALNALQFIKSRKGRFHHKYTDQELLLVQRSKFGNSKMGRALYATTL